MIENKQMSTHTHTHTHTKTTTTKQEFWDMSVSQCVFQINYNCELLVVERLSLMIIILDQKCADTSNCYFMYVAKDALFFFWGGGSQLVEVVGEMESV